MATAKIGLIGCGGRLQTVLKYLFQATTDIEIAGVYDPSLAACQAMKEKFKSEAKIHQSYESLLQDKEISWVFIGSWNCYHAEQIIAAFKAGKNIFCEKPLALTVEDCAAIKQAWEASQKQFVIGFTLRYSPHYHKVKELISTGTIGQILSFEFNETLSFNHGGFIHADWRRKTEWAGSHLLEKCCHDIDLANWFIESKVVKAASFGGCDFFTPKNSHHIERLGKNKDGIDAFQTWQKNQDGTTDIPGNIINPFNDDKDIVDNQVAILQYQNGVRATFHTNCLSAIPERRMYICGTEGAIRADVLSGVIEVCKLGFNTTIEKISVNATGSHGAGDAILGQSLANTILKGAEPLSRLSDALYAAITAFGIDEALRTQQVYELKELWNKIGETY